MTIRKEERTVYITDDDKEFTDEFVAEKHSYKLELLDYLRSKDCTEYFIVHIELCYEDLLNFFLHNPPPKG